MRPVVKPNKHFYFILFAILFAVLSFCLGEDVYAHGGGLDSSSGHNCYVGSCAGTYHYHGGGSKGGSGFNFLWVILLLIVGGYFLDARREKKQKEPTDVAQSSECESSNEKEKQLLVEERVRLEAEAARLEAEADLLKQFVSKNTQRDQNEGSTSSLSSIENWLLEELDMSVLAEEFDDHETPENEWNQWKSFKAQHKDGDTIRMFSSPQDYWDSLCGIAGYALIRNDEIITTMITEEN